MKAEITNKNSDTISFRFEMESPIPLKEQEDVLGNLQAAAGYHPHGYGWPMKIKESRDGSKVVYTWECSGSCD